jgi:nucleotide-binding universal stress UspA family protein
MNDRSTLWPSRLLGATDFSQAAELAQNYAILLARASGGRLHIVHVSQPYPTLTLDAADDAQLLGPVRREVSNALDDMASRLTRDGVQASATLTIGTPSEEIIRVADAEAADLIVLGSQGRTALEHVLLGSTAERVVKGAACPVLTVRADGSRSIPPAIRHLIVPTDFSRGSADALEAAIVVAHMFKASITLVHVLEWSWLRLHYTIAELADEERIRRELQARLEPYAEAIRSQELTADIVTVGGGGPADFIVDTAASRNADLIVMGTHGRRGIQRALIGSVAEGVLRRASCPVLTIKEYSIAPGRRRTVPTTEPNA